MNPIRRATRTRPAGAIRRADRRNGVLARLAFAEDQRFVKVFAVGGQAAGDRHRSRQRFTEPANECFAVDVESFGEDEDVLQRLVRERAPEGGACCRAAGGRHTGRDRAHGRVIKLHRRCDQALIEDPRAVDLARGGTADAHGGRPSRLDGAREIRVGERSAMPEDQHELGLGERRWLRPATAWRPRGVFDLHRRAG